MASPQRFASMSQPSIKGFFGRISREQYLESIQETPEEEEARLARKAPMEAMRMQAETGKLFAHFTTLDSNDSPAEPDASPASDAHVDDPAVSASTLVQSMITQWALPAALPAPGTFTRMMMDAILGDLEADEPDQFWAEPEHHIEPMDFLGM